MSKKGKLQKWSNLHDRCVIWTSLECKMNHLICELLPPTPMQTKIGHRPHALGGVYSMFPGFNVPKVRCSPFSYYFNGWWWFRGSLFPGFDVPSNARVNVPILGTSNLGNNEPWEHWHSPQMLRYTVLCTHYHNPMYFVNSPRMDLWHGLTMTWPKLIALANWAM